MFHLAWLSAGLARNKLIAKHQKIGFTDDLNIHKNSLLTKVFSVYHHTHTDNLLFKYQMFINHAHVYVYSIMKYLLCLFNI